MLKTTTLTISLLLSVLPSVSVAQPVSFYQALNMVFENLDEIVLAKATRDASTLATKRVIADQKPTLSLSAQASNNFVGGLESIGDSGNASSVTLSGRWTAYQFGRKKIERENAFIDERNADLTYYKTASTAVKTLVNIYFSVIEIRKQYEVQLQSEKLAQTALVKDKINYQNRNLAESVYLNSQAKYARIQAGRAGLKVQLDNIEKEFSRIMGFEVPAQLPIPDLAKVPLPASLDIAIEQATAHNPDLKILSNTIDKLKNQLTSQNLERKGSVTLSASSRKNVHKGGDLANTISVQYNVAFDIFKTNRYKAENTALQLSNNTIRLKIETDKTRNTLLQHWQVYITQKNMLQANILSMQASNVAVKTQRIMYETGQGTSAELLEKIEMEINATKQYVTGLKKYATAVVDILTITGNMTLDKFSDL